MPSFSLSHADEFLRFAGFANRNYQATTDFQVWDQGLRDPRPSGRNQNSIVGPISIPTQRPIKSFDCGVVNSQVSNPALGLTSQFADALDRVNLRSQLRQH